MHIQNHYLLTRHHQQPQLQIHNNSRDNSLTITLKEFTYVSLTIKHNNKIKEAMEFRYLIHLWKWY